MQIRFSGFAVAEKKKAPPRLRQSGRGLLWVGGQKDAEGGSGWQEAWRKSTEAVPGWTWSLVGVRGDDAEDSEGRTVAGGEKHPWLGGLRPGRE